MGAELLLEIGTEEIPARFLRASMDDLTRLLKKGLGSKRLKHGEIKTLVTPRRLIAQVLDVDRQQPDIEETKTGPAVKASFDKDGKPTKAALGFARGQGVDVENLERITTEKGEYIFARKHVKGLAATQVLAKLLPELLLKLNFPKSMKWGTMDIRYARPLHRIVAVFDGEVIPFMVGDVQSTNRTVGHRFLSPDPIEVTGLADTLEKTEAAGIVIDHTVRKEIISREIDRVAAEAGGRVVEDPALLDEVTFITESPYPILGRFEEKYLELPREVVITPMRAHQKYFPIEDTNGNLLPNFIAVSDIKPRDPELVATGYAKVLRARLEDARFFFEEDKKIRLERLTGELSGMIFQKKLGSYADKVDRIQQIADHLAEETGAEKKLVSQATELCKSDLLTHMVGEFPELQGIMGMHYARLEGIPDEVADAIREHYLPKSQGGPLPETATGAIVAVADKMDTIAGMFGIGQIPKGSGDPYALRRAALGVIAIVQSFDWPISLQKLINESVKPTEGHINVEWAQTMAAISDFFRGRLFNLYTGKGFENEVVESVLSAGYDDLCDLDGRLKAVDDFHKREDFKALAFSFKRVANILDDTANGETDTSLLEEEQEITLHEAYIQAKTSTEKSLSAGDYAGALDDLAAMQGSIDGFFDHVLVNCDDENTRTNRKALLAAIAGLFKEIADFRCFSI